MSEPYDIGSMAAKGGMPAGQAKEYLKELRRQKEKATRRLNEGGDRRRYADEISAIDAMKHRIMSGRTIRDVDDE